ncbi:GDSL-type esterase/lipase family protein [Piscinibacter sp. XHJ-5]|uniref:GDSL-type esterase/lipase family protein n=1 Tax=Piscinibacter sp. XHJ-5 TaxID=3037797 RepID=UPI0024528D0E|nr:GDSL-type esterase/lipase family protein [Piscinibacter sp. XHJ-5]
MAKKLRRVVAGLAGSGLLAGTLMAHGQGTAPVTTPHKPRSEREHQRLAKWQETLDAFAASDRLRSPRPGGVLFVGSSSIRLWDGLEKEFDASLGIIKRGFGGSSLADCVELADRLVLPYKPRRVVVYAGDNDLAEGASPEEVLGRFVRFVERVRGELPGTQVSYLSIKPSPARHALQARAAAANALIERYAQTNGVDYIDVYSRMLDADGRPRDELFIADKLHLNAAGYALWHSVIAEHLNASPAAGSPAVQTTAAAR